MQLSKIIGAAAFCAVLGLSAAANATVINASNQGWISEDGTANTVGFNGGINNVFTGFEGQTFNDWFDFVVPNSPVTSATLSIWNDSHNTTIDPGALYQVFQ